MTTLTSLPAPPLSANQRRGISKPARIITIITAVCLSALGILSCHNNLTESFYPSLADAKKSGAINRGWIPGYLPESSRDIHEVHRIEHARTWCTFEFLSSDSNGLRTKLKPVTTLPSSLTSIENPRVSWWPAVLLGDVDQETIHGAGFELYVEMEPLLIPALGDRPSIYLFAMDWSKGRGFFYETAYRK
jgi:hypothetical protein